VRPPTGLIVDDPRARRMTQLEQSASESGDPPM